MQQLPLTQRHFVGTCDAIEPTPVGCAELADVPRDRTATLGAVALGRAPGRLQADEITVYKAMGVAMEDHVAACRAYEGARALGVGSAMAW